MRKKHLDIWSYGIILFFTCFLLYGLCVYRDYGLTSDDEAQRYHSIVTYNDMVLGDREYVTKSIDTTELPSMSEYSANYGVIMQLPLVLIEHLNGFEYTYLEIFQMRHLYVFLWVFIALIFFYRLCLILTDKNRLISFLGVIILILSPRILADSFYNIKDALCMALYIIAAYFGVLFIRKESLKTLILFVVFAALCTTTRVVGGVLIGALVLAVLGKSFCEGSWRRYIGYVLGMIVLFAGAYILMTPKSWGHILQELWSTIKTFSNYTTWNGYVYYMGEQIKGYDLPWHYLLVWIGITTPVIPLVLMAGGTGNTVLGLCKAVKKREVTEPFWINVFLLLSFLIPFLYVVILRPTLYNGWRHFYFTYPLLVIQGVLLLDSVWKKPCTWRKGACLGGLAISFLVTGMWVVRNHPYEYVYFNPLFRRYAFSNFDLDYWAMTELECYQYILENDSGENIKVISFTPACSPDILSEGEPSRMTEVSAWDRAEWVIDDGSGFEGQDSFECVKSILVDGHAIRNVWKRKSQNIVSYEIQWTLEGEVSHDLNDITWIWEETDGQLVFTGTLLEAIPASQIQIDTSSEGLLAGLQLSISDDGEAWEALTGGSAQEEAKTSQTVDCPVEKITHLRVAWPSALTAGQTGSFRITLQGDMEVLRTIEEVGNRIIAAIETNYEGSSSVKNVKDENRETRWEVNNQQPGVYLDLQLKDVYDIQRILLDYGASKYDYPKDLHIYTSMDGINWTEQEFRTEDNQNYYFTETVACSFIRLELGDTGEPIDESWSIYEIKLF